MTEISHDKEAVSDRIGADEVVVPIIKLSDGVSAATNGDALRDPTVGEVFGGLSEEKGAEAPVSDVTDDGADLLDETEDSGTKQANPADRARLEVAAALEEPAGELAVGGSGVDGIDHTVPPTSGGGDHEYNGVGDDGEDADDGDVGNNVHDGQERTGMVVEFGVSEDNRTPHELSPAEQLDRFHERIAASGYATFGRTWIRDEARGVEVYIRDGSRPVRRVVDALGEVTIGGEVFALQGRCLEISDIKRTGNDPEAVNPVTAPELFLQVMGTLAGYAERAGIWDAVSIDNLGDPAVSQWCTDNGWEEDPTIADNLDPEFRRPDFLYKPLPGRGIVSI